MLSPRTLDSSVFGPYISVSNMGLMRKDLITLFHDNAFGIDVDVRPMCLLLTRCPFSPQDNYRVVVFRDLQSVSLPSHLARAPVYAGPDDQFLREHFRWCLKVHLLGGDIMEDYDHNAIATAAEELGLCGDGTEMVPLDDERWHSVLGRELLADHISSEIAWARDEEWDED